MVRMITTMLLTAREVLKRRHSSHLPILGLAQTSLKQTLVPSVLKTWLPRNPLIRNWIYACLRRQNLLRSCVNSLGRASPFTVSCLDDAKEIFGSTSGVAVYWMSMIIRLWSMKILHWNSREPDSDFESVFVCCIQWSLLKGDNVPYHSQKSTRQKSSDFYVETTFEREAPPYIPPKTNSEDIELATTLSQESMGNGGTLIPNTCTSTMISRT